MESVSEIADSRIATGALLTELRKGHLTPSAVALFIGRATHRSLRQMVRRPRALAQLTAFHALLLALAAGRRPGRGWVRFPQGRVVSVFAGHARELRKS